MLAERPSHVGAVHGLVSGTAFAAVAAVCSWALQSLWVGVPAWADGVVSVAVAAVLVFALGEALPRALVAANAEAVGLSVAGAARALTSVLYPARAAALPAVDRHHTSDHRRARKSGKFRHLPEKKISLILIFSQDLYIFISFI